MNKNPKNLIQTLKRLPRFWLFCLAIVIVYIFIRLFFTPHLLSDTYFSRAYYDRNGQLLRLTLSADEKYRIFTPYNQIPPDIIRATILYEDKYFYAHPGINPVALFRATRNYISGNTDTAGASTITMQLARIKYNINTKTIPGTFTELAAPCKAGDTLLIAKNAGQWPKGRLLVLAFHAKEDSSDLPNYTLAWNTVKNIKKKGDAWEVRLTRALPFAAAAGTKLRLLFPRNFREIKSKNAMATEKCIPDTTAI